VENLQNLVIIALYLSPFQLFKPVTDFQKGLCAFYLTEEYYNAVVFTFSTNISNNNMAEARNLGQERY
jgi:hypothetical protein